MSIESQEKPAPVNLLVTEAFDSIRNGKRNACTRLWIDSLLKTGWAGDIQVIHAGDEDLFSVKRSSVTELRGADYGTRVEREMRRLKATMFFGEQALEAVLAPIERRIGLQILRETATGLDAPERYDWIVLASGDCLALRNVDHLFQGPHDILLPKGRKGEEEAVVAVRGRSAAALPDVWNHEGGLIEGASSLGLKIGYFEAGEIGDARESSTVESARTALLSFSGIEPSLCGRLMWAFYLGFHHYLADRNTVVLSDL